MPILRNKIYTAYLFLIFFMNSATIAQAQDPRLNISIDPAISAIDKQYKDAYASLTAEQQAQLDELEKLVVPTIEPKASIKSAKKAIEVCQYPDLSDDYKQALFNNLRIKRTEDRFQATNALKKRIHAVDFIDKGVLIDHVIYQTALSDAMFMGLLDIVHNDGMTAEMCADSMAEMMDAMAAPNISVPMMARVDSMGQKLKMMNGSHCTSNYSVQVDDKHTISLVISYMQNSTGQNTVEFSAKVRKGNTNNFDTIEHMSINFDGLDARDKAKIGKSPNGRLVIGMMKPEYTLPVFNALRSGNSVFTVTTDYWDKPYSAYIPRPSGNQLDEFASCIATISPEMKSEFRENDYSTVLAVNTKHIGQRL